MGSGMNTLPIIKTPEPEKILIEKIHFGIAYYPLSIAKDEICRHAIQAFDFLLEPYSQSSWKQFCDLILNHTTSDKAKALVAEILA